MAAGGLDDDDEAEADYGFTEATLQQPQAIQVTSGSQLRVECGVTGHPAPHLVWLKVTRSLVWFSIRRQPQGNITKE